MRGDSRYAGAVTDRAAHRSDPQWSGFRVVAERVLTTPHTVVMAPTGSGKTTSALLVARFAAERAQFLVHRTLRDHFGLVANDIVLAASLRRTAQDDTGLPGITASTQPEESAAAAAADACDQLLSRWASIGQSKRSGQPSHQPHSPAPIDTLVTQLLAADAALEQFLFWVDAAIASTLCDERYEFVKMAPPTDTSPCGVLRRAVPREPRAPGASCALRTSSHPAAAAA